MKEMFKKYNEVIRYVIAGVLTTIVSLVSYYILRIFDINYLICTVLSWVAAVIFAYFINKIFVFKSSKKINKIVEFLNFVEFRLVSLGIEFISMYLLVDMLNTDDKIAKLVVQVIVQILNYIFSKLFVFKK